MAASWKERKTSTILIRKKNYKYSYMASIAYNTWHCGINASCRHTANLIIICHFKYFNFMCVWCLCACICACVCMCVHVCMCTCVCRYPQSHKALDILELLLSQLMWVLGTEPRSSARTPSALNHWASSPASHILFIQVPSILPEIKSRDNS